MAKEGQDVLVAFGKPLKSSPEPLDLIEKPRSQTAIRGLVLLHWQSRKLSRGCRDWEEARRLKQQALPADSREVRPRLTKEQLWGAVGPPPPSFMLHSCLQEMYKRLLKRDEAWDELVAQRAHFQAMADRLQLKVQNLILENAALQKLAER